MTVDYRKYLKVSNEDIEWLRGQDPCVLTLWLKCALAEKFGRNFQKIEINLSHNSFVKAKKALDGKLFKFRAIKQPTSSGRQETIGWEVRNLHGALTDYWGEHILTEYQRFLNTDYWLNVRNSVLERDNYTCQGCASATHLHVHHMTYENHGSEHEHLNDLITLCEVCHRKVHGIED